MAMKIYAAGFDLFAPDGAERCQKIYDLCLQYGFDPYVPGVGPSSESGGEAATAQVIYDLNLGHLKECDVLMANLNDYRGSEPDSGTVFEVGYACARGIPVYSYMSDTRTTVEKMGGVVDADGWKVEDFGQPANLMLACGSKIVQGGPEECLKVMAKDLLNKG